MDSDSRTLLRYLQDRQDIEECMSRYAHALDRHDERLIAEVYHSDAQDSHGPFRGGVAEFAPWVNRLHEHKTRSHTHNMTTHWCEVQGDRAYADTYVLFVLFLRDRDIVMMGSGRYIDRMERRAGRWKIAERRTITELRLEADAQRLADAPGGYPVGTWDRSDVSYQRPLALPIGAQVPRSALAGDASSKTGQVTYEPPSALAVLSDCSARRAIKDCITQTLRGLDRSDRELALQQFRPGARVEDGAFHGTAEDHVTMCLSRFEQEDIAVTHNMTSHLVELGERSAATETYVTVMRYGRDKVTVWVGGIRLLDRLSEEQGHWRIVSRNVVADWEFEANGAVFQTDDQYLRGRRDRKDLSYDRG
jgi:hypothetical protein